MIPDLAHVSLFSGIGGIDRAMDLAGVPTVLACEFDKAAAGVLADGTLRICVCGRPWAPAPGGCHVHRMVHGHTPSARVEVEAVARHGAHRRGRTTT